MPTFIPGTNCVLTLDNGAGSPTDVSTTTSKADYKAAATIGKFYTFSPNAANKTEGKRDYSGTITGVSAEDTTSFDYIVSAWFHPGATNTMGTKTLKIETPDATAGSYRYSGEIRAVDYQVISQDASGDGKPTEKALTFEWDSEPTREVIT